MEQSSYLETDSRSAGQLLLCTPKLHYHVEKNPPL